MDDEDSADGGSDLSVDAGNEDSSDYSGMPDWTQSLIGAAGQVGASYFNAQGAAAQAQGLVSIASAQAQANAIAQQRAYMSQLSQPTSLFGGTMSKQTLYIAAGILVFMVLLRQTAQA